ncbi:MAG: nucleoside deaminase [Alphaproteobacteria bacterium]|nr:nucleoside deaminase [Alphaproteobacteria bacterium]
MTAATHEDFINLAIELARAKVAEGGLPYGAVVVLDGKVIGDSSKRNPTLPAYLDHAELVAIMNACAALKAPKLPNGCILYSNCESCDLCSSAAKWVGITEAHFAINTDDAKDIGHHDDMFIDRPAKLNLNHHPRPDHKTEMKDWYDKNWRPAT